MYMNSWDKLSLESYKAKCEKLEKENEKYIIIFSSLYDNDRQYTKKIKEQEDLIDTMSDQLAEEKNTVKIQQTTISKLEECLHKKDFENEHFKSKVVNFTTVQNLRAQVKELQSENKHLKSKVVDCTMCQNLQVHVEELKSVNESLNLSVEELSKARALVETTLRERDELIFAQCEKIRLLEEQCEPFYEVQSEFDSEIVHGTQDNSEKDLILSLQTQLKEAAELVVRFSDEKYFALKEIESLKDEIKSLQIENQDLKSRESELNNIEKVYETKESVLLKDIDQMKSQVSELVEKLQISDQEMKQQIILFEEDKRMFLARNEFQEKVSSSMQKEYNDLLASNDVLKHRLKTKFKFLKHDNSLEKMFEMIDQEYKSNDSEISITSSTIETKNFELVKEMGDKVKRFDEEKKVFENKISKLEKVLAQRVKEFADVKTELSKRTDKFETYFANLEKENALLKSQLTSQNYTSLQKENNDLRTSYNVLKEKYEISCETLEKENNDLKMHYKRLFDSIKQKKIDSQVFTKSIPEVNVSKKIYTGKSSTPFSRKVSQFTIYSLQKDRKYLKKQHSSEIFASQNQVKNESLKQVWKRKENISKRLKYSRDEMFSMRKRDDSVLKKVKDVRFPFISKRIFQNETPSFNNKWKSSSSSRVKISNETPGFRTVFTPLRSFKTPNEISRFYKSKWTNGKSFKTPLIPRKLFQNETLGFKSPWNSTSMHQIDATYIWVPKYGKHVSNMLKWVPKVTV
ncbi:hypothetical protein Tco_0874075 [Tanacetum coccineum]|uniref:Uncharacterized protein n=1 Tax=Tanacetum coccineum TaxID=301880 RepID=A0ABQ5BR99_9ASTR